MLLFTVSSNSVLYSIPFSHLLPQGSIYGLTFRLGVPRLGSSRLIADLVYNLDAKKNTSMLLVGQPGAGKTTLLRDVIRILANEHGESGLGLYATFGEVRRIAPF